LNRRLHSRHCVLGISAVSPGFKRLELLERVEPAQHSHFWDFVVGIWPMKLFRGAAFDIRISDFVLSVVLPFR
jgi:hypothetical protein